MEETRRKEAKLDTITLSEPTVSVIPKEPAKESSVALNDVAPNIVSLAPSVAKAISLAKEKKKHSALQAKKEKKYEQETYINVIKTVAFGTGIRVALEKIAKARTGTLVVVANDPVFKIIKGGFKIDCKLTTNRLAELSKMDGAIILDKNMKKILYAGTLLAPNITIKSSETGSRHQAAERTAKQTGTLVIAVSQRTGIASLYHGLKRYTLKDISELLTYTRESLGVLEKHRRVYEQLIKHLNVLEVSSIVKVSDVALALQRAEMISRISGTVQRNIVELGKESTLFEAQFKELVKDVEKEMNLIIKDYKHRITSKQVKKNLRELLYDNLLDTSHVGMCLGYSQINETVEPRGYRMLSHIDFISNKDLSSIIKKINLAQLLKVDHKNLGNIKGLSEKRSAKLLEGIRQLKDDRIMKL